MMRRYMRAHALCTRMSAGIPHLRDAGSGAGTGPLTHHAMNAVAENVTEANLTGTGHLAALEDPTALAETLRGFYRTFTD